MVGVITAAGLAGPALAASDRGNAPPGNNGTIKIAPLAGCQFNVEFFGYDAGTQTARLVFEGQAPTGGGSLQELTTTWTTADRTGGNQLDTRYGPVDLKDALAKAGVTPSQQGYHVRLTVHVTGSKGADAKHKVFWVAPCSPVANKAAVAPAAAAAAPAAAPAPPPPAPSPAAAVMGESIEAAHLEAAPTAPSGNDQAQVLGEQITQPAAAETSRSGALPFTGANLVMLLLAAAGFVGAGVVALRTVRSSRL